MPRRNKLWKEYIVYVESPVLAGGMIPLCGLCGNSGVVDTTASSHCWGKQCGTKRPCICPNGRFLKKRWDKNHV